MKKIIVAIAVSFLAVASQGQTSNLKPVSISFPKTGTTAVNKISTNIIGADKTLNTAIPTNKAVNDRIDSLSFSLLTEVRRTITTTNNTAVTIDTLPISANTAVCYDLVIQGYDNTGVVNDMFYFERRVIAKHSDGVIPTPIVQNRNTDIAEGTLNAAPPDVTVVSAGGRLLVKLTGLTSMNIPWTYARTVKLPSSITSH
ncbi:MAG: hypothetical protein ABIQ88_02420 [Chitinophagaceae bacterium]